MAEADPQKMFNVHEAKTHLSRLIDRAHGGEELVLAKGGVPWAKLVPIGPAEVARKAGGLTVVGHIPDSVWFEPLPEDELALWEGRADTLSS